MTDQIAKAQQLEIQRQNQLYSALIRINRAVVRLQTREALFKTICDVLVEHGGFQLAWIAWHDPDSHQLLPVAQCGDVDRHLDGMPLYTDGRAEQLGPGIAFTSRKPYVCNDLNDESASPSWRHEQQRRGSQASAAFPIELNGRVEGLLGVYAAQKGYFKDQVLTVLTEASVDLSFALDKMAQATERTRLEEDARRERRFANSLIETMPGIFYLYDQRGKFLRWNRNFEAVSGYSGAEIAAMQPLDFFEGDDRQRVADRIAEVFALGEGQVEASMRAKDGRATPHFFTGKRITFDGSTCLVGVGVDICERKHAEEALSRSEERYRSTLDSILEACQLLGFDWRYLYLNNAAAIQNRRPNEELLGRSMLEAWPGIEHSHVFGLLRSVMDTRIAVHEETEFVFADGSKGWFDVRAQPVPEGVFVLSVNITERRNAELLLRELNESLELKVAERTRELSEATERAEAADRIKSAFLATMSHELRTPLNSIIGFTGIMLQGLAGKLNPEQDKQLGMVQGSARHLLALINDVLDISKIEAGQLRMRFEPFDLRTAIERTAASVKPMAEKKGIAIVVGEYSGLIRVNSDQRRVEQILINLLNNAIKFTDRGQVTLLAELLSDSDSAAQAGQLRIRVVDTGIGMKKESLPLLFQPFQQVDSGLGRQHEGTGLGLAICWRLARLLGGSIGVESSWGEGSTFVLTLPAQPPEVAP